MDLLQELKAAKLIEDLAYNEEEPNSLYPKILAIDHLLNCANKFGMTSDDHHDKNVILGIASRLVLHNSSEIVTSGQLGINFKKRYETLTKSLKK